MSTRTICFLSSSHHPPIDYTTTTTTTLPPNTSLHHVFRRLRAPLPGEPSPGHPRYESPHVHVLRRELSLTYHDEQPAGIYLTTSNSIRMRHHLTDDSDEAMLNKYEIKANDAILAVDKHKDIFEERQYTGIGSQSGL